MPDWNTAESISESLKAFHKNLPTRGRYFQKRQVESFHQFLDRLEAAGLEVETHRVPGELLKRKRVSSNSITGEVQYSDGLFIERDELLYRVDAALNILKKQLERKEEGTTKAVTERPRIADKRIFIGHGRSNVWKDLKEFLTDGLHLKCEEYNVVPTAGMSRKERLLQMLEVSCFAFLVMTGDDETERGERKARDNVIHEVGLFQGRLGFEKAIVLLEEGCQEFSNIEGLDQIRFPAGNIMAKSEEIRRVLEREGLLS